MKTLAYIKKLLSAAFSLWQWLAHLAVSPLPLSSWSSCHEKFIPSVVGQSIEEEWGESVAQSRTPDCLGVFSACRPVSRAAATHHQPRSPNCVVLNWARNQYGNEAERAKQPAPRLKIPSGAEERDTHAHSTHAAYTHRHAWITSLTHSSLTHG